MAPCSHRGLQRLLPLERIKHCVRQQRKASPSLSLQDRRYPYSDIPAQDYRLTRRKSLRMEQSLLIYIRDISSMRSLYLLNTSCQHLIHYVLSTFFVPTITISVFM